jgi:formate hydrogenlyase subunit 3/multisubunit Na+/H+ antiporter MnhD subunit
MNTVRLALIVVFALCGAGAALGTVLSERRNPSFVAWTGSLAALWASGTVLCGGEFHSTLWTIRSLGMLSVSLDRLSAFFLFVAAVVVLASSIFSASYMKRYAGRYRLSTFTVWYLLLFASITWILLADDVLGFLPAWEAMSISSYLLVNFEHQHDGTSRAAYLMLAMGEAGFMAVEVILIDSNVSRGNNEGVMGCWSSP